MSEQMIQTESNNEPKVYQIVPANMVSLQEKLAKLNKKAVKLGTEPIILTIVGEKMVEVTTTEVEDVYNSEGGLGYRPSSKTHFEKRYLVTVAGVAPKLNGWSIAAVIEHTEGGNILRAVPPFATESFDVTFRTSAPTCDHCGYDRKRKDTYIVRNDDGRQNQVGRTCLKDFTGHKSPEAIATWAEIISCLDEMIEGFGGSGRGERYFTLSEVLETAACVIRRDGFMSKATARKIAEETGDVVTTTAGTVSWLFSPTLGFGDAARKEREAKAAYVISETDTSKAQLAQEWAATQEVGVSNDYLWNLRVVANMEMITYRNMGLAVSMISAYQRECDRLAGVEYTKNVKTVSQFVGVIGQRQNFTVTLNKVIGRDGQYGHTTIHLMTDEQGNKLTWFKSGYAEMEEGKMYVIAGRVEKHEVYHRNKDYDGVGIGAGEHQTKLSRCKIVREIETVAADESVMNIFATTAA